MQKTFGPLGIPHISINATFVSNQVLCSEVCSSFKAERKGPHSSHGSQLVLLFQSSHA